MVLDSTFEWRWLSKRLSLTLTAWCGVILERRRVVRRNSGRSGPYRTLVLHPWPGFPMRGGPMGASPHQNWKICLTFCQNFKNFMEISYKILIFKVFPDFSGRKSLKNHFLPEKSPRKCVVMIYRLTWFEKSDKDTFCQIFWTFCQNFAPQHFWKQSGTLSVTICVGVSPKFSPVGEERTNDCWFSSASL